MIIVDNSLSYIREVRSILISYCRKRETDMYCSNCGKQIEDGSKFCVYCGAKVGVSDQPKDQTAGEPIQNMQESWAQQSRAVPPEASIPGATSQQSGHFDASNSGIQNGYIQQYQAPAMSGQPSKPRKKKTGLVIVAVILLLALAGGGGWYFLKVRPEKLCEEYLSQSHHDFGQGDYDSAIELIEKAYDLKPDDPEVNDWRSMLYFGALSSLYNDGRYEEAVEIAKQINEKGITSELDISNDEYMAACYVQWILSLREANDDAGIESVLADAKQNLSEEAYQSVVDSVSAEPRDETETQPEPEPEPEPESQDQTDIVTNVTDIKSYAERVAGLTDIGYESLEWDNIPLICEEIPEYTDIVFDALGADDSVTVEVSGYMFEYVEFCRQEDSYYIYYGQLDGSGVRNGNGFILDTYDYSGDGDQGLYFYVCQWVDGVANGSFIEYNLYGPEFSYFWQMAGTVKNWLYDGEVKTMWTNGVVYESVYHDGIVEVIGTDEDGLPIIAKNKTNGMYLTGSEDQVSVPTGLEVLP